MAPLKPQAGLNGPPAQAQNQDLLTRCLSCDDRIYDECSNPSDANGGLEWAIGPTLI
jgi:hypothetical protein